MNLDALRDRLDLERRQLARISERLDILPDVTRVTRGQEHGILFSTLSAENADGVIAREIAHHRALGMAFEWKLYSHDQPSNISVTAATGSNS